MFSRQAIGFLTLFVALTAFGYPTPVQAESFTVSIDWEETQSGAIRFFGHVDGFTDSTNVTIKITGLVAGTYSINANGDYQFYRNLTPEQFGDVDVEATEDEKSNTDFTFFQLL